MYKSVLYRTLSARVLCTRVYHIDHHLQECSVQELIIQITMYKSAMCKSLSYRSLCTRVLCTLVYHTEHSIQECYLQDYHTEHFVQECYAQSVSYRTSTRGLCKRV